MKITFLIIILAFAQNAFAQCDSITVKNVTHYTPLSLDSIVESEGLRNGSDYKGATLFFPVNENNTMKSIVLVPGYQASQISVTTWAKYLASRGFIAMTIGTNLLGDNPTLRAKALIDGMETIRKENNRTASPLFGRIDTNSIGVGGWSMGGGGAQLSAKMDTRVKVVLAIAPWLGRDINFLSDLNHSAPVIIISGQYDAIATNGLHSDLHYTSTPTSTNKLLVEISGGSHFTPLNPYTGKGDIGNTAYAWLKMSLENNDCYCKMLKTDSLNQHSTTSKYLTTLDCSALSVKSTDYSSLNVQLFPNPVFDKFTVEFSNHRQLDYVIYDPVGQQLKNGKVRSGETIKIGDLSNNLYFFVLEQQAYKLLKK